MATYNSAAVTALAAPASHGLAGTVKAAYASVSCTAAPSTSDTLNFFDLPAGARVIGGLLKASDMDTNGSPSLTLNIGDAGDADRLFAAATVGKDGSATTALAATGAGYKYTSKTRITGVAGANAATGAAGTVELTLFYIVEG